MDNKIDLYTGDGDSTRKNLVFQFLYQFLILGVPLIVAPYLTRKLGSSSLGIYSYTYSIAYYFVMFAMLGINKHGQRIIAERKHDFLLLRRTFWSLFFLHICVSLVVLFLYFLYVCTICSSDRSIAFAQGIYVLSAVFDITWFFYGLEKFRSVVIRNTIVKSAECVCIFTMVKEPSDLWKYTIIMCISVCLGQIVMIPQAVKNIPFIRFSHADMLEHVKPLLTLFFAVVAASLYTTFDKTLLGLMSSKSDVAYYEYSNKIIRLPQTLIGVLGTVLYPRVCQLLSHSDKISARKYMNYSVTCALMIGIGAVFGLLAVSRQFVLLYYGNEFEICGTVIGLMTPLILIVGLGDVFRSQYLYPMKKDAVVLKIMLLSAIINLICTVLLIPVIGIYGAVAGTVLAETTAFLLEVYISREVIDFKYLIKEFAVFFGIGVVMFALIRAVADVIGNESMHSLIIQVIIGICFYGGCSVVYLSKFNKSLLKKSQ